MTIPITYKIPTKSKFSKRSLSLALGAILIASDSFAAINWNIEFADVTNNTEVGFDDPTFGSDRQLTFNSVLSYINTMIADSGTVDFTVQNSETDGAGFLASAGTYYFTSPNGFSSGLLQQHATTGTDPSGGIPDAEATFDFGYNWNSQTDTSSGSEFDLYTVSLHEVTHAMGFSSLLTSSGVSGISGNDPGVFSIYDSFLELGDGTDLFAAGGDYVGSASDLVSNDVFFNGPTALAANGGSPVQVYAPSTFAEGSSISHLNASDEVMYYAVAPGVEKREYSAVELAILMDIGWTLTEEGLAMVPEPNSFYLSISALLITVFLRRRK